MSERKDSEVVCTKCTNMKPIGPSSRRLALQDARRHDDGHHDGRHYASVVGVK